MLTGFLDELGDTRENVDYIAEIGPCKISLRCVGYEMVAQGEGVLSP